MGRLILLTSLHRPSGNFFKNTLLLVRKPTSRLALRDTPRTDIEGLCNGPPCFEMGESFFIGHVRPPLVFPEFRKINTARQEN
jgi:hypothetical protein